MNSEPTAASRSMVLNALIAAFAEAPIDGQRLLQLGRRFGPMLRTLEAAPLSPPPSWRAALSPRRDGAAMTPGDPFAERAFHRAMLLLFDLCAFGAYRAMANGLDDAGRLKDGPRILSTLAQLIEKTEIDRALTPSELDLIARHDLWRDPPGVEAVLAGLEMLGLSRSAPLGLRHNLFHAVVGPGLQCAASRNDIDLMLAVEGVVYEAYIKAVEEPAHHVQAFGVFEAAYTAIEPRPPATRGQPGSRPKVAFFIPNGVILAHTEVLLSFLAGLKALPDAPIEPIVLIHRSAKGGELGKRLDALGVPWAGMAMTTPFGFRTHFEAVRAWICQQNIDGLVFVSLPLHIAYFCREPLAPVQIWWSLKFALPNFDALDGRVFFRSLFNGVHVIDGEPWRGGPIAITPPPPPAPATVEAIRARFAGQTILGTIAREEKIANRQFLDAVIAILHRHPQTCFLWTGGTQPAEITEAFAQAGVGDRCHFVGWVDPAAYIMAFDVMLETYPLTGLVFGWAMALGKPVISVGSLGIMGSYLEPILDGSVSVDPAQRRLIDQVFEPLSSTALPGIWARTPAEMPAFADALVDDPNCRTVLGAVQKAYIQTFLADEASSAAAQAQHFADIVLESRARD